MKNLEEQIDDAVKQIGNTGKRCYSKIDAVIEKHALVLTEKTKERITNLTAN